MIPLVLVADDTMERERARNDLAEETKKVNEGKLEASKWKSQYNKAKADAEKLREQVELLVREKYEYVSLFYFLFCFYFSSGIEPITL